VLCMWCFVVCADTQRVIRAVRGRSRMKERSAEKGYTRASHVRIYWSDFAWLFASILQVMYDLD